ncbi:MAG: QueT transporter family protein [Candidatus Xenobiia bacterium LiM19]
MTGRIRYMAAAAMIAALYAVLTLALEPLSYGPVQCRISEALTVLPVFSPAAVPGLFVGCFIANLMGPNGLPDVICGSLCTLLAASGTYHFRRRPALALLFPVLVNAFGISAYLSILARTPFWYTFVSILTGETLAVYGLGLLLIHILKKSGIDKFI